MPDHVVLPPGLTLARRGHPLAIPIAIATLTLIICPFLSAAHQRLVIRLLASLRQWTLTLIGAGPRRVQIGVPGKDR